MSDLSRFPERIVHRLVSEEFGISERFPQFKEFTRVLIREMPIVESAIASVTLAEAVRYVREGRSAESEISGAIENAAETAAGVDERLDPANVLAVIDTEGAEDLVASLLREKRPISEDSLRQVINEDVLDGVQADEVLECFVKSIEYELVKRDGLDELLQLTYAKNILLDVEEVKSDVQRVKKHTGQIPDLMEEMERLRRQLESGEADFDVLSDVNVHKLVDFGLATTGLQVKSAADPELLTDEKILKFSIENDCVIATHDYDFVSLSESDISSRTFENIDPRLRHKIQQIELKVVDLSMFSNLPDPLKHFTSLPVLVGRANAINAIVNHFE